MGERARLTGRRRARASPGEESKARSPCDDDRNRTESDRHFHKERRALSTHHQVASIVQSEEAAKSTLPSPRQAKPNQLTQAHLCLAWVPHSHHLPSIRHRCLLLFLGWLPAPRPQAPSSSASETHGLIDDGSSKVLPLRERHLRDPVETNITRDHLKHVKSNASRSERQRKEINQPRRVRLTIEVKLSCSVSRSRHFQTDMGSSPTFCSDDAWTCPFMTSGRPRRARSEVWSGGGASSMSESTDDGERF